MSGKAQATLAQRNLEKGKSRGLPPGRARLATKPAEPRILVGRAVEDVGYRPTQGVGNTVLTLTFSAQHSP
jgi:hypothetical protein